MSIIDKTLATTALRTGRRRRLPGRAALDGRTCRAKHEAKVYREICDAAAKVAPLTPHREKLIQRVVGITLLVEQFEQSIYSGNADTSMADLYMRSLGTMSRLYRTLGLVADDGDQKRSDPKAALARVRNWEPPA